MNTPVDYVPWIMRAIDLISQGYTKTRACDDSGISTTLFDRYVRQIPELSELAQEAFERHYDTLADVLVNIDTDPTHGNSDPKMAAVLSKNIQWYLSRRRPKEYGDRVQVEHTITADKVIVEQLAKARDRVEQGRTLEGVAYRVLVDGLPADEHAELAKLY